MDISSDVGQKHTIITADQPLYSRGKQLVCANPKFEHVIFMLRGLHICFNFLKGIGQHMESAGLDNLWTELGVFACNTTETMLAGKAYYRAVRGHQLTYEALWRIKWAMFESWLQEKNLSEELDVSDLAKSIVLLFQNKARNEGANENLCAAMDELSNAMNTEQVQSLMKDFEREHSDNPNFKLWSYEHG